MTLKSLFNGKVRGTNAALPATTQELVTIYTVPASTVAFVKEILMLGFTAAASVHYQLYVLKSGGTDVAGSTTPIEQSATNVADCIPLDDDRTASLARTRTAMNLVLNAGDAIKLRIVNVSAGALTDLTTGLNIAISGDESA